MNLRLTVTKTCQRSCPLCATKQFKRIPKITTFAGFDEIILTGGEPLLFPRQLFNLIHHLRATVRSQIYVYTSFFDNPITFEQLLTATDGLTITLHDNADVEAFKLLYNKELFATRSIRINAFDNVNTGDLPVKQLKWLAKCSVPANEKLRQLKPLFERE